MRKLMVTTFLTLDGVMQAPGGPGEDDSGGFTLGGWSVNYWDERMGEFMTQTMSVPFDLLLGRRTYDIFVDVLAERSRGGRLQAAERRHQVRRVAGSSHAGLEGVGPDRGGRRRGRRGAQADGRSRAAGARQREPDPDAHGHDLVDEYRLWVFPVVIGSGKRLFADGSDPRRAEARRQHGLDHGRRDRHVRARGRDRHGVVLAGGRGARAELQGRPGVTAALSGTTSIECGARLKP